MNKPACKEEKRKNETNGRFPVFYLESKNRDLIKCLGSKHRPIRGIVSEQVHFNFLGSGCPGN